MTSPTEPATAPVTALVTALVTGAASGIGRACAVALARDGAAVTLADRDTAGAEAAAAEIRAAGGRAQAVALDVTDPAAVDAAFAAAEGWAGPVGVLITCAGILDVAPFEDYPLDAWDRVMRVNVTGTLLCCQRAAGPMVAAGTGRIVSMASISGVRAGIGRTAYGTSKAAVSALTRQMALELGPKGVTVNAIAPGAVTTAMTEAAYSEDTKRMLRGMIPAGYIARPEDIAAVAVFLARPEARYVNGETIAVDGGYLASGMTQTGTLGRVPGD